MHIFSAESLLVVVLITPVLSGCQSVNQSGHDFHAANAQAAKEIEYPAVTTCEYDHDASASAGFAPRTLEDFDSAEFEDVRFEEILQIALANNQVIRDLGGRVLAAPESARTVFDSAIRESDPLFGTEGALSDFDAQFSSSLLAANNDRVFNNIALGGGAREVVQDTGTLRNELSKVAADGTRFSMSSLTRYDESNQPDNLFPGAWDTQLELGLRHPLLQGGGIPFNQIAGPEAQPGFKFSSGVLIARTRTDISNADFETAVTDLVSALADAYWNLYFAYRNLDAKLIAHDSVLKTWQAVKAKSGQQLAGGEAYKEAQAREQYHLFENLVLDAVNGSPTDRQAGVYRAERQLRRLMGLPSNDGRLLRPIDEPVAKTREFDWDLCIADAVAKRAELRRQRWQIKRRELELIAARNFTRPRLDAVARYRLRGFGDDLAGSNDTRFASAFDDLIRTDHQEWEAGFDFQVPLGFRRASAGVRNAELQLARERAVLKAQELEVSHQLSDAIAEVRRASAAVKVNNNRMNAALERRDATTAAYHADKATLDQVLDTQQRLADAQTAYFRSQVQSSKAIKNVHREKASLLTVNGIQLGQSGLPVAACRDAAEMKSRRRPVGVDYKLSSPGVLVNGHPAEVQIESLTFQATPADAELRSDACTPPEDPLPDIPQYPPARHVATDENSAVEYSVAVQGAQVTTMGSLSLTSTVGEESTSVDRVPIGSFSKRNEGSFR